MVIYFRPILDIKCTLLADRNVKVARIVPACPKAKGKDDIKYTLQADHRNGGKSEVRIVGMPQGQGKDDIKCTLQADHGNGGM